MKTARQTEKVKWEIQLEISLPEFRPFETLKLLDVNRLSKGNHLIEFGKFQGCDCDCVVRARIKQGKVVGLKFEKCKNSRPISGRLLQELEAARRRLLVKSPAKWEDFSVADLIDGSARLRKLIDITISSGCIMVCWGSPGQQRCVICCLGGAISVPEPTRPSQPPRPFCIGPSEPGIFSL